MTQTSPEHAEAEGAVTAAGAESPSGDSCAETDAPLRLAGTPAALDAFDEVVAEHESALLRYARHQLGRDYEGRHHDAQDIVQEALLRLHRQWRQAGPASVENVRAWLMRVVHNLVIDAIRKRTRQRDANQRLRDETKRADGEMDGVTASVESREATDEVMRLMHELPENQQRVMMLRLNDLTVRQIAEVLNMSPGNVGYHMNQALTTLARQMKQAGAI